MMGNFWHREKTTCAVLLTLTGTLWILPIVRMETCNPSLKVRPVVSITSSPKNNRLRIGASMNLTCTAQPRDADSVYPDRWVDYIEWYDPQGRHVGAKCKQPSNVHAHRPKLSCPLLLKNLTVDSLGVYTCQAGNGYAKHCTRKSVRITVDGGWSEWNSWSICTKPVGGIQTRERECTNPEPAFLGKHCDGNRAQLRECSNTSSCHEAFPLRFKTEKNPSVGRMEIYTNSSWQKLCTSQWDEADLNLTCMAMGYYNNGVYANDTRYAERGNASKKSNYHNCTTPTTCQKNLAKKHQFCKVPVRLNGANMEYGGRVEVFYKGKWTKICRNGWDLDDVKVICRQLGFEEALAEFIGSEVNDDGIPFAMSDVSCKGDESELASCARIDGKVNIPPQCLSGKGSQALCQPKNKTVLGKEELYFDIGTNEKLQCSIHNETIYAGWTINGQRANSASQRIRTKETGELFIDKVQLSDAGFYECYRLEYVRYYIVYINAKFTENTLDKQTLIADTSGLLRCGAEGVPSPQMSWRKKGGNSLDHIRFNQVSDGSLLISPVNSEDGGTFICTMKQTKGPKRITSNDKDILVTVMVRPKVNISGASNLIIEGNSVNLTCAIVAGRPEPEITWLKNKTFQKKGWSLLFPKITKNDEGWYTCKAENAAGIFIKYVEISVKVPPRVKFEFKNVNIEVNSTFTEKCYRSGDPEISVNWTKDGVLLSTKNILVIKRATFKDEGYYECTAQNDYGKANGSVRIDVTVSPQITKPPINQSVTEGHPVNFSCRASGVPTPTLDWVFNNDNLPFDVNRTDHDGESLLELQSVTKEMKGTYRCEAKNKANTTSSSAILRVYGKASAQIVPDPYPTLATGDVLTLTCQVNEDTINVTWKKNGVSPSERAKIYTQRDKKESELTIAKVLEEDGGKYSCEGRNKLGLVARYVVIISVKAKQEPRAMQGSNSLWYYIGGSVATVIVISLIACFFCRRRTAVLIRSRQFRWSH